MLLKKQNQILSTKKNRCKNFAAKNIVTKNIGEISLQQISYKNFIVKNCYGEKNSFFFGARFVNMEFFYNENVAGKNSD